MGSATLENFNPRSLTGATAKCAHIVGGTNKFQSTLPHGSDCLILFCNLDVVRISIHAPSRERQRMNEGGLGAVFISIHAPSRERPGPLTTQQHHFHFNPRSLTGATLKKIIVILMLSYFNPRSLTGATVPVNGLSVVCTFQSTLPHGSDMQVIFILPKMQISIHAPSRERLGDKIIGYITTQFQSTLPHGSDL